jgi:predicted nucleic acid-binding protein
MYVDSAYLAKFYLNEADSSKVRAAMAQAESLVSSMWAIPEVACAFHRHLREGRLSEAEHRGLIHAFLHHLGTDEPWTMVPVSSAILRKATTRLAALPRTTYIRAGDLIHLTTAAEMGEQEIWTTDRHVLAAAPQFGLIGRTA